MKFPFFASFIIFIIWLSISLRKSKLKNDEVEASFWEKEAEANTVRKKSLDDLAYIRFPFDSLPAEESFAAAGRSVPESLSALHALEGKQIVNLSGLTNTELKLRYGAPNLTILSEYDENFEQLCIQTYHLAKELDEANRTEEALFLLEEMIPLGTDISGHYKLLARIYQRKKDRARIEGLRESAQKLRSLSRDGIISFLDELLSQMT